MPQKLCTKAEQNTPLWKFAQRHPLSYEKTTEQKASQSKEFKKKYRGDVEIRRRHNDNNSGVSSINSIISKATEPPQNQ